MLGFDDDKYVTKDTWYHSGEVNINHDLKNVKVSADIIEKTGNFDENGRHTDIITTLPIDTQQPLFSTRTVYSDINARVPIVNNFNSINFSLSTNSKWHVDAEALLDVKIQ